MINIGWLTWGTTIAQLPKVEFDKADYWIYGEISPRADGALNCRECDSSYLDTIKKSGKVALNVLTPGTIMYSILKDSVLRESFLKSLKAFVDAYSDGLVIDWEPSKKDPEHNRYCDQLVSLLKSALPGKLIIWYQTIYDRVISDIRSDSPVDYVIAGLHNDNRHKPDKVMKALASLGIPPVKLILMIDTIGHGLNSREVCRYSTIVNDLNPTPDLNTLNVTNLIGFNSVSYTGPLYWQGVNRAHYKVDLTQVMGYGGVCVYIVGFDKLADPRSILRHAWEQIQSNKG